MTKDTLIESTLLVNDVEKRLYTMFVSLLGIKGTRKSLGTWKKRKHAEESIIKQQK
jgi:hypothetical protein